MTSFDVITTSAVTIYYHFYPSSLGLCLIATIDSKLCFLSFPSKADFAALQQLQKAWPKATLQKAATKPLLHKVPSLIVRGTPFQLQVWRHLMTIPQGTTTTYKQVAHALGKPLAHRAVASAIGANRIAVFIPCHRVIQTSGAVGGYRWGSSIKKQLLAQETGLHNEVNLLSSLL